MKVFFCAFFAIMIASALAAQSDVATAKWMQQPVTIDGVLSEWKQPLNFYDADTKLLFDIADDSSNIYLCFKSQDEANQTKMMRGGMKITLSMKGKPRHEASISYPLSPRQLAALAQPQAAVEEPGNASNPAVRVHDLSSFRNHFIESHATMMAEGFVTQNGTLPIHNAAGIQAAINWDSTSNLIYEIAIPKKEFIGKDEANRLTAKAITLSVEINAMPRTQSDKGRSSTDNSSGEDENLDSRKGQFNGGSYGSGNGGIRHYNAMEQASLTTKSSFKQKFTLSNENK